MTLAKYQWTEEREGLKEASVFCSLEKVKVENDSNKVSDLCQRKGSEKCSF